MENAEALWNAVGPKGNEAPGIIPMGDGIPIPIIPMFIDPPYIDIIGFIIML
jgi:hypothetical protein